MDIIDILDIPFSPIYPIITILYIYYGILWYIIMIIGKLTLYSTGSCGRLKVVVCVRQQLPIVRHSVQELYTAAVGRIGRIGVFCNTRRPL